MRPRCQTHPGGRGNGATVQVAETTGLEAPRCVSSGLVARSGVAWIAVAIVLLAGCARPRPAVLPPVPARIGYEETGVARQRELAGTGAEANVLQAEVGGRTIYRVRVGRFASPAEATATARRLAKSGYAVIVVTE